MQRSKLEFYECIIYALDKKALTIDDLAFQCNTSCVSLQDKLEFLVSNSVVDIEVSPDNKVFYVLTRRGLAISKTLVITKRLQKLKPSRTSSQTFQAITSYEENDEEKARNAS